MSKTDHKITDILEVGSTTCMTWIQPLNSLGLPKSGYPNVNSFCVSRGSCDVVVGELDVVYPTIDDQRHQQFHVEPDVEVVFGLFLAYVVYDICAVQFGFDLAAAVARYEYNWIQVAPYQVKYGKEVDYCSSIADYCHSRCELNLTRALSQAND